MRALIVGLGSIGRRHARNWAALGLGPVSICRQTTNPQPEPLGIDADLFDDLDAALQQGPQIVFVTNPTSLHLEVACRALAAGAHVFVEKPISHTLEGLQQLIDDAQRQRRQVFVGYNLRFHPGLARVRELYLGGAIGRLVSARAEVGEYLPGWHPGEDYRGSYAGQTALGGGPLLTFSHELDSMCWLLGAPRTVTALTAHASSLQIDTEDVADLLLRWPAGAIGSVHMDYLRQPPRRSLELVGEDGTLQWDYEANRVLHYTPLTRQWRVEEGPTSFVRNDMFLDELRQVAACLRGGAVEPLSDGPQGAAILTLALAAHRSATAQRTIDLEAEGAPVTTWLSSLGRR